MAMPNLLSSGGSHVLAARETQLPVGIGGTVLMVQVIYGYLVNHNQDPADAFGYIVFTLCLIFACLRSLFPSILRPKWARKTK